MRITLFTISLFIINNAFAQIVEFDHYYLVDTIIQKNKIKTSNYTNASFPHLNSIYEYDTLGREILWYYINGDTKNYTKYLNNKDTLIEVKYSIKDNGEEYPYQIHKYVYNKEGHISFYASCRQSSFAGKSEADFANFYYDKSNKITAVLYYSTYNYPFEVNKDFPIVERLFKLINVENFYYNNFSQLIAKKQMIGKKDERYVDSFFMTSRNA
ncbi:MAG: hypothetical protein E6H08_15215 [Bacteroidetes bacterium]|nr:MAG: hypothetical protein E6H08_15215 [Bacteroidota bacterium]